MAGTVRGVVTTTIAGSPLWTPRVRGKILKMFGVRVLGPVRIYPWIRFTGGVTHLTIGRGAFVNANLTLGSDADIVIGPRAYIGPGVQLLPTSHAIGPHSRRAGDNVSAPIRIGAGSWLGAGVIVIGGASIGDGCVVAAGAVVTGDCEPDTLYGGVPAKALRRLDAEVTT